MEIPIEYRIELSAALYNPGFPHGRSVYFVTVDGVTKTTDRTTYDRIGDMLYTLENAYSQSWGGLEAWKNQLRDQLRNELANMINSI